MTAHFGRSELSRALGFDLSDAQWEAVSAPLEPGVIVAGAGTGKTTSMSARVAYLVATGEVDADRVLGLTFTNKAAGQLMSAIRERVAAVGALDAEPTVMTYHAFAGRVVSEFGLRIGREPDAILLTDGAKHQHAYRLVCGLDAVGADSIGTSLAASGRSPVAITQQMLELDGELSELGVDPEALIDHDRRLVERLIVIGAERGMGREIREATEHRILLARLVIEWRDYKARRDYWDYSDHLRLAHRIVTRFPDVARDIRRRYDIVLLDEYQDTSIVQRELLRALFAGGFPVTAVGDPCQAIYGWRGASVDNIESFPRHFPRLDGSSARRYSLAENRRSGAAILHVANEVATELRAEHTGSEPLAPTPDADVARVDVGLFETVDAEIDYLVHAVDQVHTQGETVRQATGQVRTIAVLCTTGADIRRVDTALRERGIPTQVSGAVALLADPAVADVRALLEVVHEPTANPATVRLLTGARWRVGARDLAALGTRASELAGGRSRRRAQTVEEALEDAVAGSDPVDVVSLADAAADVGDASTYSPQAVEAFADLTALIAYLRDHGGEAVVDLVMRTVDALGVDVEARVHDPSGGSSAALQDFLNLAAQMEESDGRMGLGGFLSRLRDAERFDVTIPHTRPVIPGAVQLMTVFAAKGLEFSTVFMPFVSEGAFPGGKSRGRWTTGPSIVPWPLRDDATPALSGFPDDSGDSINKQHERYRDALQVLVDRDHERLAYVGVTRAEGVLVVTGHWWGPTQEKVRGPHRFLTRIREAVQEADPDLCRVIAWAEPPSDGEGNPARASLQVPWPQPVTSRTRDRLHAAASAVMSAASRGYAPPLPDAPSGVDGWQVRTSTWHEAFAALSEEETSATSTVKLGTHVGATTFLRALADPDAVAVDLLRPMPRQPSPAAARGIAWHAWVETVFGQQSLWEVDDLPGAVDAQIATDEDLEGLKSAFMRSRFARMTPVAIERPFCLVIGGRVIDGRMDAVFEEGGRYEVVDWKTGGTASVDPRQLAVYRLAWAHIADVPWQQVDAAFVMVATGDELRPNTDAEVEALLALG